MSGNAIGWTFVAVGCAGLVALLAFQRRQDMRELFGVDAIRAELVSSVEVDPVTTAAADWDAHVDSAVAIANSGRGYDITCRGCGGRRITGTRQQVLEHLVTVHGTETPQQTAELALYDQEMNNA